MQELKRFIEKFTILEKELSEKKGDFVLFGLFLRQEAPNVWDVVVSAPWLHEDSSTSLDFMTKNIQSKLEREELLMVSTVLILDPSQVFVRAINNEVHVEHGNVKLTDYVFNGMEIRRAHIITSKPEFTDTRVESKRSRTVDIKLRDSSPRC